MMGAFDGTDAASATASPGPNPNGGWRVIEVCESEERRGPVSKGALRSGARGLGFAGPRPQPQFWPVHDYMK
jgi:hypothetical protein